MEQDWIHFFQLVCKRVVAEADESRIFSVKNGEYFILFVHLLKLKLFAKKSCEIARVRKYVRSIDGCTLSLLLGDTTAYKP